ncbi:ABC transporter ATP-binding protein [Pseudactinotalea sp. HY158]|uniref:ABC transporter ATP-binding protein n=1 Tax=Pseudactinotalea sp. HY158 TaxID=2654547 RepID=UPI00129C8F26|nr:ABC transporter ATP-binding protein [Pseudactinotalea sp. HY158]QGH68569.1 ATP-binding cassette domain-containing protein [Pseudactinotalea sp. HY158]
MTLARLTGVTKTFGDVTALDSVDLTIEPGTLVGMLGPNGAGKTTLLGLVQGLRAPSSGTVELFGADPRDWRARRRLGSTPQETALPPTLRVGEVIDFVAGHFPDPVPRDELAAEFGLTDLLRRQTGALSGGQKRRVSVALAFVSRPRLVLLDEPTTGLDVEARHALWEAVRRQHERGATVVVTSHYLEEIEALARRVVVIDSGRVLIDDDVASVRDRVGLRMLTLRTADAADTATIAALPQIVDSRAGADGATTFYTDDADAATRAIVGSGADFHDLTIRGATLEEAFLTLTAKAHS